MAQVPPPANDPPITALPPPILVDPRKATPGAALWPGFMRGLLAERSVTLNRGSRAEAANDSRRPA